MYILLQISSTCPVCVTYEVRSKFVITSLRPAFAKIYPSTRPDLAVETFFHAKAGSPLLRGITDDDFITWFDKTELASLKTSASIDNICECGRICSRDYEFRKNYEDNSSVNTVNVESTTETMNTKMTGVEVRPTEDSSTTEVVSTSSSTLADVTTQEPTSTTVTDITEVHVQITTEYTDNIDDPIIIPTVTYTNKTENTIVSNSLLPKINGELIIQKSVIPKTIPKKDVVIKKPLPRRKGTLKATYGDKHEKFYMNIKKIENITPNLQTETVKLNKIEDIETEHSSTPKIVLEKPEAHVLISSNIINIKTQDVLTSTESHIYEKSTAGNVVKNNTASLPQNKLFAINTHSEVKEIQNKTSEVPQRQLNAELLPHTITTITNNNIKTILYRTKKPKSITQIKKPLINAIHNNTTKNNRSDIVDSGYINKTKKKILSPKYNTKTLKSINKEIHKIPPTPISETSKSLSENIKSDIAPENKEGFDILNKNNLWELLKEGSDNDPSKIEEKLHMNHNRLNIVGYNMSNVDNHRSL